MPVSPVRNDDHRRTHAANELGRHPNMSSRRAVASNITIRPTEILPPRDTQHLGGRLRFAHPLLDCAVAAKLPFRQITQADCMAQVDVNRDTAPNPYFDVVGYMILPGMFLAGVIICPVGVVIRRWRDRPQNRLGTRSKQLTRAAQCA